MSSGSLDSDSSQLPSHPWRSFGICYRDRHFPDDLYGAPDDSAASVNPVRGVFRRLRERTVDFVIRRRLVISCVVYVLMDILTTVYYKRLMDHTGNYVMVTMESLVVYFLILFAGIYGICCYFAPTYMSRPFNVQPMLVLSVFDIMGTALSALGSVNTSGILLVMLAQVGIPLTIIACKILLGRKYHEYHYLGAFLIVLFVALKELTLPAVSERNDINSNLLYILACVPDAIASALRSGQYISESFHLVKYQFTAVALQFVFGLPLFGFFISRRLTRPDLGIVDGIAHDVKSGFMCLFLGRNTIVDGCSDTGFPRCDACPGSLGIFVTYLLCNMVIRVAYIVIMLNGTVTLVFLLGTLKVPLCSIAFSLPSISGDSAGEFEFIDVVCFVGIMLSLLLYGTGTSRLESASEHTLEQPLLPESEDSLSDIYVQDPLE
ncbi:putative chloroquine resistance transporter [Babesia sp. Xinjiang]|uniref:putative chloroquine resistance transporter n=1 Tax=Babesia sp. Xinjiang TaxID=462227 RepID=UPI000A25032C|nr:putative chloroquine resistance transporter [Babesia sp. Xinjiang]ORM42346.1 putative chloroquine resistance transporter [Babesia sp. Xinjiang]